MSRSSSSCEPPKSWRRPRSRSPQGPSPHATITHPYTTTSDPPCSHTVVLCASAVGLDLRRGADSVRLSGSSRRCSGAVSCAVVTGEDQRRSPNLALAAIRLTDADRRFGAQVSALVAERYVRRWSAHRLSRNGGSRASFGRGGIGRVTTLRAWVVFDYRSGSRPSAPLRCRSRTSHRLPATAFSSACSELGPQQRPSRRPLATGH
jgi:hypothetical protein